MTLTDGIRRDTGPAPVAALGACVGVVMLLAPADLAGPIVRFSGHLGTLVAVGVAVFLALAHHGEPGDAEIPGVVRLTTTAAIVGVAGGLGAVAVFGATVADTNVAGGLSGAGWTAALHSPVALAGLVRLLGLGVVVHAVRNRIAEPTFAALVGAGAVSSLASFLIVGHTATRSPRVLGVAAALVHGATAAMWIGGLAALAVVLASRRRAGQAAPAATVVRFSRVMATTVAALLVAGVAVALMEVDGWRGLWSSTYGRVLLVKGALVAVVAAAAAYNHRRLVPRVESGGDEECWPVLVRTVRAELLILVSIVAVTALLINLAPEA